MGRVDYDFTKHTIQDPVHGSISFGPIEKRIIDHRLYQRLRGLRQNSLLYLVFPSANHTRFDHSVGVMWVASRFFDAIISNQQKICSAGAHRKSYQSGYRVDNRPMSQSFEELDKEPYFRIVLRAAALFHDIGHGPLSHLFDKFFPTVLEVKSLLSDARYQHIHSSLDAIEQKQRRKPISHEVLSCIIATRVLHDISETLESHKISVGEMVKDVCAAIDKDIAPGKRTTSLPYNVATLLHDIISSDIDADRMDYLMRDSHMCGVNYGLYDQDRILKSMCAYADMKNNSVRASIRYSAVGALEDLLIARYQMHAQIYGHKTNRACSAMLNAIREKLKEAAVWKWYEGCVTLDELLARFAELDDQRFIALLCERSIDKNAGKVKDIAEKLFVDRRLVKRVFEERVPSGKGGERKERFTERRVKRHLLRLKNASLSALTDIFENKGPKIKRASYPLKVLRKHHKSGYYQVHELKEFSTVAHYLPEMEKTYRIYAKEKNVRAAKALMPT